MWANNNLLAHIIEKNSHLPSVPATFYSNQLVSMTQLLTKYKIIVKKLLTGSLRKV